LAARTELAGQQLERGPEIQRLPVERWAMAQRMVLAPEKTAEEQATDPAPELKIIPQPSWC